MSGKNDEMIVVDVPPGYAPMSTPIDPASRFGNAEIVISRAEDKDLLDVANGMYTCFPEVWWAKHEPLSTRPTPDVRAARLAKRIAPMFRYPYFVPIKASLRSTGEFMGYAGWLLPNDHIYKACGGSLIGPYRYDAAKDEPDGLGFAKAMGWSADEIDEMWEAVDLEAWRKEFGTYDRVRHEELGAAPHWYLSCFYVHEKFRGRGVGKMLLDYAAQQADAQSPPTPMYVEALPNARPVYMHCGYEPQWGPDRKGAVMVRNKPNTQA